MGDRVSIQFEGPDGDKSVVLFSHWGGLDFVEFAEEYARKLSAERRGKHVMPLDRLQPETVMVDFIRHLVVAEELATVESGYYLGVTETDGDNSDNGHHVVKLGGGADG